MFYENKDCAYRILGVYHVYRDPRNVLTKARNYIGFAYRIQGCNTFSFGEDDVYAGDGSVVYLPKGVAFRNKSEGPEELVIAHLQPFGNSCKDYGVLPNLHTLEPLFRKLLSTWEAGDYNRSMEVLYSIFHALQEARQPEQAIPPVIAPGVHRIRQHFRDPRLTVAQAAKACFISEVYFRRVYRQHFGISPLQDILRLRFDYAAGLLRSGYYSVEQTARMSGFSDVKYFRTAFTKHFGKTPTQHKNN